MQIKSGVSKKLFLSSIIVLFFIILIAVAGDICIRILKKTSHLVVIEFAELDEIQNILLAFSRILPPIQAYLITGDLNQKEIFEHRVALARRKILSCKDILTERHNKDFLDTLQTALIQAEFFGKQYFNLHPLADKETMKNISGRIETLLDQHEKEISLILIETKAEVSNYVTINETATRHSAITIISLGVLLALTVILGGYFFIKKLTSPIIRLLDTIQLVTEGNIKAKVEITSRDEFGKLAGAFNSMLDTIDEITVSRNYYTNILDSMFNSVIVSDAEGKITSLNKAACMMLGDSEENLSGVMLTDFMNLSLHPDISSNRITLGENEYQPEITILNRKGMSIPVFYARSAITEDGGNLTGYVSVFHDLTEQKSIEQEIRQIRRERAVAIHDAQEKERLRIATDLHDGIVQMLTSVSYSIQTLESEISNSATDVRAEVTKAKDQVNMAIAECRRISHNLIPLALHDFGLVPAISNLIGRINQENPIRFHFDSFNMEQRTDPRIEKVIYRIFQESVNNILKHSQATEAHIQLIRHEDTVVLIVEDDGIGFNPGSPGTNHKGIGLEAIKARVDDFGGNLTIQSSGDKGTELIIEIPYVDSRS